MRKIGVIGLDDGFDFIKVVSGPDDQYSYPSIYKDKTSSFDIGFNSSEVDISNLIIKFRDREYYVGDAVFDYDVSGSEGIKDLDNYKYRTDGEKAKILAGIWLTAKEDIEIDMLVHGLNISSYSEHKKAKENELKGTFDFEINGESYVVKINNSKVIPEGLGAFWNEYLNYEGERQDIPDEFVGIIDIGGKSTDFFIAKGSKHLPETVNGIESGVADALKIVAARYDIPRNKIEHAFITNKNVMYNGKEINIRADIKSEMEQLAKNIATNIKRNWNSKVHGLSYLKICGGGSELIKDHLKSEFEYLDIDVFEDPKMANAIGFYKLGKAYQRAEL